MAPRNAPLSRKRIVELPRFCGLLVAPTMATLRGVNNESSITGCSFELYFFQKISLKFSVSRSYLEAWVGSIGCNLCPLIFALSSDSTSGFAGNFATAPLLRDLCPSFDRRKSTKSLAALGWLAKE